VFGYVLVQSGTARSAAPDREAAEQAVISHVGAFRRAAEPADVIPAADATISGVVTRKIGDPSAGSGVWASLSTESLCVQLAGGASACIQPEQFAEGRPLIVGASSGPPGTKADGHPSSEEVAGVVPDGIASVTVNYQDGTSETTPVVDNGFYLDAKHAVKDVAWTTTDGVVHQGQTVTPAPATSNATEER
jgi:hypothetical protein